MYVLLCLQVMGEKLKLEQKVEIGHAVATFQTKCECKNSTPLTHTQIRQVEEEAPETQSKRVAFDIRDKNDLSKMSGLLSGIQEMKHQVVMGLEDIKEAVNNETGVPKYAENAVYGGLQVS